MPESLDSAECHELLKSLPGWEINGNALSKVCKFETYLEGLEFAKSCGEIAEEMNHHPDLLVQWRKVTVTITTHSCAALTSLDFEYAGKVESSRN